MTLWQCARYIIVSVWILSGEIHDPEGNSSIEGKSGRTWGLAKPSVAQANCGCCSKAGDCGKACAS